MHMRGSRLRFTLATMVTLSLFRAPSAAGMDRLAPISAVKPRPESGLGVVHILDVAVSSSRLITAGYSGVTVFDISALSEPRQVGNVNPFASATTSFYYRLAKHGNVLYVTRRSGGLEILRISPEGQPEIVGNYRYDEVTGYECVSRTDSLLALGAYDRGAEIVDVSDPLNPSHVAFAPTARALAAEIRGTHLFVADLEEGMVVFDLAEPTNPTRVAEASQARGAQFLDVDGDLAAVAAGARGIYVFDVSNPGHPTPLAAIPSLGSCVQVRLDGTRLLTAEVREVQVYDLSEPRHPIRLARQRVHECVVGIDASGDFVVVADWDSVRIYELRPGDEPDLLVEPCFLSFGAYAPGVTERLRLHCENVGNATLVISDVRTSNQQFTAEKRSFRLEPGDSASIPVTLAPSAAGELADTLHIFSNDSDEPVIGVPLLAGTRDFGPGDLAPDFSLEDALTGGLRSLSDFRGQPILLTFFAGW